MAKEIKGIKERKINRNNDLGRKGGGFGLEKPGTACSLFMGNRARNFQNFFYSTEPLTRNRESCKT